MLLLFLLSMMSKATGVTLPLLLLLLDFWPLGRLKLDQLRTKQTLTLLLEKLPIVLVTAGFSAVALLAQHSAGATDAAVALPIFDRITNAIVCYVIYMVKLAWPVDLAAFYPHPGIRPVPTVISAGGLLVAITWIAWRLRKRMPWLLVGWIWFLITLLPMIGLVQLGGQAMADRYSYVPSIGLFIALAWTAGDFLRHHGSVVKFAASAFAIAGLILLCGLARRQVSYWQDTRTLFAHSVGVTGPNPVASFFMGTTAMARGDAREAIADFTEVVKQDPGNDKAFEFLGKLYADVDANRAVLCYQQAVDLQPARTDYRIALAIALARINDRPSLQRAYMELQKVLRLDPNNPQAINGQHDIAGRLKALVHQANDPAE
jgi:hypothetical protein